MSQSPFAISLVAVLALGLDAHAAAPSAKKLHAAPAYQRGLASIYSRKLASRPMADGTPLRLDSDAAASRTLPLGSAAVVTNLRNGRSVMVRIRDRGPWVRNRIIDLSPRTARELGIGRRGVARVQVTPAPSPADS